MENDNELYHWGILGMKWGHRSNKRMGSNGEKMTTVRGKVVPKMTSVKGKPVQVYARNPKMHGTSKTVAKTMATAALLVVGGLALREVVKSTNKRQHEKDIENTMKILHKIRAQKAIYL